jgi:ABC-type branched-subunit amino acid transport system substrate-binding protein
MPINIFPAVTILRRTLAILIVILCRCTPGPAAEPPQDRLERQFQEGLAEFRAGKYSAAATAFGSVADARAGSARTTAACIMAAKAEYRGGNYAGAKSRAGDLLARFPGSAYADAALYVSALSDYRLGDHDIAASTLVALLREHPGSRLAAESTELFRLIVSSHLPLFEQKRLAAAELPPGLHAGAALALARSYARRGEDSLAAAVLDDLGRHREGASSREEIAAARAEIGSGEGVQVAALLPLMEERPGSEVGRIGRELLDGIRMGAEEFNAGRPPATRVDVTVLDTGRDTAAAAAHATALAAEARVRAVIGPVFSDDFAAASGVANSRFLPIISPTATADRLAAGGPFIFQANPDNSTRGRALARYAVRDLRMSSFAVLASDDPVGRAHAGAFVAEAAALGATVYCTVFFPPEASDLRQEFLAVRRAVMADGALVRRSDLLRPELRSVLEAYGVDSAVAAGGDSATGPYASVTELFGARGYVIAESLGLPIAVPDTTAEETDTPLAALDGIFVALGEPGQIDYVAPQIAYFNIRAQVLGNNEWYDPDRLRENRGAAEGVIFISDSWIDDADSAVMAFTAEFSRRNGKKPTKFTLYGYDTMNLVLEQLRAGARTRNDIAARLSDVAGFRGLHSEITLRGGRVNGLLHVLQYSRGTVLRLGSVGGEAR